MKSDPVSERRRLHAGYVPPHKRRKRGGQPGNRNALTHGAYTPAARAKRRATFDLFAEVDWAIAVAWRFQRGWENLGGRGEGGGVDNE